MPDSFNLIVNVENPIIKKILEDAKAGFGAEVDPLNHDMKEKNEMAEILRKKNQSKKEDEVPVEEREQLHKLESEEADLRKKEESIIADYASKDENLRQLIDLALLANNMLKGEALNKFIKRSTSLLAK
jgi:hypothetical protein